MPSLAPMVPLASAGAPWRSRRGWTVAISVLLHLLVLLALLGVRQRPAPDSQSGPAYDLVFDTPGAGTPALPPSTPADLARPEEMLASPPAPPPTAPPAPDSPTPAEPEVQAAPPPPLAAAPTPSVAAPQPAPPQATTPAAPAMAFAPPPPLAEAAEPADAQVVPTPAAPPEVRLNLGPPPAPQPIMPVAPPALPPPTAAAPRPRPQPRAAPGSSLSAPMDLSFAPAAPPRAAPAPRGSLASRTIDLSLGPPKAGPNRAEAFFAGRAKAAGADWEEGLKAYWLRHRYYPRQAAESGEDGIVEIEMTVNRYGRVESVSIKSGSGSQWLDMAALGTWRNAQLPPLPAELKDDRLTLTIPIHYILIR